MARTQLITLVARVLIGGFFILAGAFKIADPLAFAFQIDHYRLMPWSVSALTAIYLPWLEVICGVALLLGIWSRVAAIVIGIMLVVFVGALVSAWLRGLDISCGCLGGDGGRGSMALAWAILRDVVMIGGIVHILRSKP